MGYVRNIFWLILFSVIIVEGQEIQITYDGWGPNFTIPADTTWREYRIPVNLIEHSPWPVVPFISLAVIEPTPFTYPDSSTYLIDLVKFGSGYLETFEDTLAYWVYSGNGTEVRLNASANTPDGSSTSLQFTYLRNDTLPINFTISLTDTGASAQLPDTVGLWLKARHPVNLRRYVLTEHEIRRTELIDWRGIKTRIYPPYPFSDFMYFPPEDSIELAGMRWDYYLPDSPAASNAIYTEYPVYIYTDDISKVRVDGLLWDFDSRLNPPDSLITGYYLGHEGFEEVLGQAVFVKHYYGMLFDELVFGYGTGLIARSGGGTGDAETLVGLVNNGNVVGVPNISNLLLVYLGDNPSIPPDTNFPLYPPDTSWYRYNIPLENIVNVFHLLDQFIFDSLTIQLMPEIYLSENYCGILLLDQIEIRRADSVLFLVDDFESTFDWQTEIATNGSDLFVQISTDCPPGLTGNSLEINFGNSWQWGQFGGWIEKTIVFDSAITLHANDELTIWIKDRQLTVGTKAAGNNIPNELTLHQNYPNPFNPVTTLRYELPEQTHLRLAVYDLLGKEVAVLADMVQGAGIWNVRWDASNIASGIYFYQLQTGKYTITRKLVVLK